MTDPNEQFERDARRVLEEAEHDIAPETLEALAAARRAAVAEAEGRGARAPTPWLPVGALAATVLAVGVAYVGLESRPGDDVMFAAGAPLLDDELEQLAVAELELLEELEFLAWMAMEEEPGNAG